MLLPVVSFVLFLNSFICDQEPLPCLKQHTFSVGGWLDTCLERCMKGEISKESCLLRLLSPDAFQVNISSYLLFCNLSFFLKNSLTKQYLENYKELIAWEKNAKCSSRKTNLVVSQEMKEMFLQFTVLSLKCKKQCSPKRLNWFWVSCKVIDILTLVHDQTVSNISAQKGCESWWVSLAVKGICCQT